MLTILVHPDQASLVPAHFDAVTWTDLPMLSEEPKGLVFLAEASQFPGSFPWLDHSRVLNGRSRSVPRHQLLPDRNFNPQDRYPVVLRVEHRGGCVQSPPLFTEEEVQDTLVEWHLRSIWRGDLHILDPVEDPFSPFVSGSFLKLGDALIAGRRLILSDWNGEARLAEGEIPDQAADWARAIDCDIAEITYLEQNGAALPWRVDDGLAPFLAYLTERPAARDALEKLAESRRDSGAMSNG